MVDQPSVRVLTLDSLPVIHAGVGQLLAAFSDITLVAHAYTVAEAQEPDARFRPDIALVEIGDLDVAWPEALAGLARALPGVPLVVFTTTVEVDALRHTLRAGAQGYLLKNTDALSLAQALRAAAAGRTVFAPEALEVVVALQRDAKPGAALLSPREREVLTLLALGLSNDEIAVRLHSNISTVKYHCRTLFQKLHVATRGQAVAKAYAARLVPLTCSEAEPTQRRSEPGASLPLVRRA